MAGFWLLIWHHELVLCARGWLSQCKIPSRNADARNREKFARIIQAYRIFESLELPLTKLELSLKTKNYPRI